MSRRATGVCRVWARRGDAPRRSSSGRASPAIPVLRTVNGRSRERNARVADAQCSEHSRPTSGEPCPRMSGEGGASPARFGGQGTVMRTWFTAWLMLADGRQGSAPPRMPLSSLGQGGQGHGAHDAMRRAFARGEGTTSRSLTSTSAADEGWWARRGGTRCRRGTPMLTQQHGRGGRPIRSVLARPRRPVAFSCTGRGAADYSAETD